MVDINNDAWLEVALYDTNQNGVIDMYRWDTDFLEGWENVALDLNENGTNDGYEHLFSPTYWPSAPAAVGSIYSPTGLNGAMETTADMLGPWFSSADWDGDLTQITETTILETAVVIASMTLADCDFENPAGPLSAQNWRCVVVR